MKKHNDLLDALDSSADTVKKGIDTARKGKKLLDYWSPANSEQRRQEEQQAKEWRYKEYTLQENFKILWIFMIIFAILEIIFFGKVGLWLGITNGMLVFLILGGGFIVITLIFAMILFCLRK